jgi:hypothetical protein
MAEYEQFVVGLIAGGCAGWVIGVLIAAFHSRRK